MDEREYFLPERVCDHYFEVRDEAGKLLAIYGTWHRADRFRDGRPWVITRVVGDFLQALRAVHGANAGAPKHYDLPSYLSYPEQHAEVWRLVSELVAKRPGLSLLEIARLIEHPWSDEHTAAARIRNAVYRGYIEGVIPTYEKRSSSTDASGAHERGGVRLYPDERG